MRSVTASDLMVPIADYPCVPPDSPLKEAAEILENTQITMDGFVSMPRVLLVLGEGHTLEGIVRRRDILRGLGPDLFDAIEKANPAALFPVDVDPNLIELLTFAEFDKLGENSRRPVSEVMKPIETSAEADENIVSLLQKFTRGDLYLLPVMEGEHVIGVVRTLEVLRRVLTSLG